MDDEASVSREGIAERLRAGIAEQAPSGRRLPIDPDWPGVTETSRRKPGWSHRSFFHPATLAVIAVGGAAGTLVRVELGRLIPTTTNGFPWPTFTANLIGSFVLGLVIVLVLDRLPPTRYLRPLIGTGVCGGLTTFSTLMVEIDLLVKAGRVPLAIGYLAATLVAGLVAVWAGTALARRTGTGRRPRTVEPARTTEQGG